MAALGCGRQRVLMCCPRYITVQDSLVVAVKASQLLAVLCRSLQGTVWREKGGKERKTGVGHS